MVSCLGAASLSAWLRAALDGLILSFRVTGQGRSYPHSCARGACHQWQWQGSIHHLLHLRLEPTPTTTAAATARTSSDRPSTHPSCQVSRAQAAFAAGTAGGLFSPCCAGPTVKGLRCPDVGAALHTLQADHICGYQMVLRVMDVCPHVSPCLQSPDRGACGAVRRSFRSHQ